MNLPNRLTLSRVLIIPFFVFFVLFNEISGNMQAIAVSRVIALLLFIYAGITDIVDGYIARKRNLITNLGRLFDPLADKLINTSAFVSFVQLGLFPAWIVILILSREFLITGLRSLGTMEGRVIHASKWGKHKTMWQIITIIATLLYLCVRDIFRVSGRWEDLVIAAISIDLVCVVVLRLLIYICAFFTLLSGVIYFVRNIDLIKDEV